MNRDELLTKLAMELGEWPKDTEGQIPEDFVFHGPKVGVWGEHSRDAFSEREWLQRRAELINRPSWDDAPGHAVALAQNEDGKWYWHIGMPKLLGGESYWGCRKGVNLAVIGDCPAGHNWQETLERRPKFLDNPVPLEEWEGAPKAGDPNHYGITTSPGATAFETDGSGDSYMFMTLEEQELPAEERHDCDRCGGSWWSPMNDHCPCLDKVSKYHREIKPGVFVDIYDVLRAWHVENPALQHLIKKALQPGERGHKNVEQDMADIVESAKRAQELES